MRSNTGRPSAVIVVQDFSAELDLRDLPGEAAGFEFGHATRSAFVKSFCEPSITFLPRCRSGRITAPRRTHHEKVVYSDRPPPPPEDVLWAPWARSIRRAQAPRLPLFMPLSVGLSRRCRRPGGHPPPIRRSCCLRPAFQWHCHVKRIGSRSSARVATPWPLRAKTNI